MSPAPDLGLRRIASDASTPSGFVRRRTVYDQFTFSHPGPITTSISGKWSPASSIAMKLIVVMAVTTSPSDTTVEIVRDGSTAQTVTLPAGDDRVDVASTFVVNPLSQMQVSSTDGTAADVTVTLIYESFP